MTGEEIARQMIMVLSTELGLSSHVFIAAMHDRASVNLVAMRPVSALYNQNNGLWLFSTYNRPRWEIQENAHIR